jgi:glycosyltransferase involved in cell wall biosynthesis
VVIGIDASRLTATVHTGTERYSRAVIAALIRQAPQHQFRLYARDLLPLSDEEGLRFAQGEGSAPGNIETIFIDQPRLWTHVGLAREIAASPPDALFIPAHVLPFPQALHRTTRTVVTIHDVGYRHFPGAHPWRQRLYLDVSTALTARCASALVVDSEVTRRDVQRFYHAPAGKIRVAYPGLLPLAPTTPADADAARAKFGVPAGRPYALYVGTLQPRKNLRRLLRAWRQAFSDSAELPLLILAGAQGWGGEDLRAEVASLGLASGVIFTGYVSDIEKAALLRGARAFAFPSLYEGFGLPVLEAQSAGVPVVCSNTSSLPEVAGDAALLVDPLDEAALARALRQAMCDECARARLIAAGTANVARFSWEACAAVVLECLEGKDDGRRTTNDE